MSYTNFDDKNYKNDGLEKGKESEKITKKFNDYKLKFNSKYTQIKGSLNQIEDNIINYNSEIKKLEGFLNEINQHDKNYKDIINNFTELQNYLQETITIEKMINQLSASQQVINMTEYVSIYNKMKEIYKYFEESKLQDKQDFLANLNKLMSKGFKVFQDLFYVILKRYEQLKNQPSSEKTNNEKLNLLNKIKKLSNCLQDEKVGFDFTVQLIQDRSQKLKDKIDEIKMLNKRYNRQKYEKGSNEICKLFIESINLYEQEEKYVKIIFSDCEITLQNKIIKNIFKTFFAELNDLFQRIINTHKKFDNSFAHSLPYDYPENLDILDTWYAKISKIYSEKVEKYNPEDLDKIRNYISIIEKFCVKYIGNFLEKINILNNEKVENENLLTITTDTISFISTIIVYENAYKELQKKNKIDLSLTKFIDILVTRLEEKSNDFIKKYPPLKHIFLLNNIFFIYSKITQDPLNKFFTKEYSKVLKGKVNENAKLYLECTWRKMTEVTFSEKNDLIIDKDTKELKTICKELIKKRFETFNEELRINLKIQQQIQIIDKNIQKVMISNNINYVTKQYQKFIDKYGNVDFAKNKGKFIIYKSSDEVAYELNKFFSASYVKNIIRQ